MALGMILENGWPECGPGDCDQLTIPGTPLKLPIRRGIPHRIMQAFFRDMDAYIEPANNSRGYTDEGSWTEDNSVYTSNHKGATAVDWNWSDHAFGVKDGGWDGSVLIRGSQVPAVRELLAFYTFEGLQLIWWGNDWRSPIDGMHFQMGYGTATPEGMAKCQRFINQFIRPDGYSTYRRGSVSPTAPTAVDVLARATGLTPARAAQILPTMSAGLRQAECTTPQRGAQFIAHTGHESDDFNATEEYASGAAYEGRCSDLGNCHPGDGVRFKGRTWIQITGRAHYTEFSRWAFDRGLVPSPTYFVDRPTELADMKWAGIGAAWYWTVSRPMNALVDAGESATWGKYRGFEAVTAAINGGTNGLAERRARYNRALALGDQLLTLTAPTESVDPLEELLMIEVHSWSIYAKPGEGKIPVYKLIQALDAHGPHEPYWEQRARGGDLNAIQDLARVAQNGPWNFALNRYVDDPVAKRQALSVLLEIQAAHPEWITAATPGKA